MQPKLGKEEIHSFLDEVFPQMSGRFSVKSIEPMKVRVAMQTTEADLRPGGTVSGPTIFTLADCGFYIAVLSMIGRKALAVTTSCSIDFMRKPEPGQLVAEAVIHKLGRVLVVGDVLVYSEGADLPVARASLTYSIPPAPAAG